MILQVIPTVLNEVFRDRTDKRVLFPILCIPASLRLHALAPVNDNGPWDTLGDWQ